MLVTCTQAPFVCVVMLQRTSAILPPASTTQSMRVESNWRSEKEVNSLLAAYHPDTASLRRYLVGYRFLKRERGIYRRAQPD